MASLYHSYAGQLAPDAPSWQLKEYEVCYCDPSVVLAKMFDNLDYNGQFDYTPYVKLNDSGKHCWNEFMSGNYAWCHVVCIIFS